MNTANFLPPATATYNRLWYQERTVHRHNDYTIDFRRR